MDVIAKRNALAAARAKKAGLPTYQHEVIDAWPACVECGEPIRHRGDSGSDRTCLCRGVRWRSRLTGPQPWERVESEGRKAGREAADAALDAAMQTRERGDQP